MKACLLFIHLISSFLSNSTLFLWDIFLKFSFSCSFIGKSTWFIVQTSQSAGSWHVPLLHFNTAITGVLGSHFKDDRNDNSPDHSQASCRVPLVCFFPLPSLPFRSGFMSIKAADSWVELVAFCTPYLVKALNSIWFGGWERSEKIYFCVRLTALHHQQLLYLSKSINFCPQHPQAIGRAQE